MWLISVPRVAGGLQGIEWNGRRGLLPRSRTVCISLPAHGSIPTKGDARNRNGVRWNIASVTIVNNNDGGNQSKRGFDRAYGGEQTAQARELWTYSAMNFAQPIEDMGALGIRVEKPNDIAPALARALAGKRPAVIDVTTAIEALAPTAVN
jgi:Thiamine pyrophosphate enzyme, C-terminal TPP binding domain